MFAIGRAIRSKRTLLVAATFGCAAALFWGSGASSFASSATSSSAGPLGVTWMQGYAAPGTPAKYNKVGVIKVGPSGAKNVLVLEPGTSAAAAYFVPLAKWIVSKTRGWQVWSVERRENLLEDQSELNLFKEHKATARSCSTTTSVTSRIRASPITISPWRTRPSNSPSSGE